MDESTQESPQEWTIERLREDRERFRLTPEELAQAVAGAKQDIENINRFRLTREQLKLVHEGARQAMQVAKQFQASEPPQTPDEEALLKVKLSPKDL